MIQGKNTNDSEPLDELDRAIDRFESQTQDSTNRQNNTYQPQYRREMREAVLRHYRSVRDIEAALPGKKNTDPRTIKGNIRLGEAQGYNQAIDDIRSSLNLDGGTKHE